MLQPQTFTMEAPGYGIITILRQLTLSTFLIRPALSEPQFKRLLHLFSLQVPAVLSLIMRYSYFIFVFDRR